MADFIARVAIGTTPAGTGSFTLTGTDLMDGHTPVAAVVFVVSDTNSSPTTTAAHAGIGVGVTDGTTTGCNGGMSEDNKGTTDSAQIVSESLIGLLVDENQGGQSKGTKLEISFTSFTADTMTLNCGKNEDSDAYQVMAILFVQERHSLRQQGFQLPTTA